MTYGLCVSMAIKFTLLQTMEMCSHMAGDNSVAKKRPFYMKKKVEAADTSYTIVRNLCCISLNATEI